MDNPILKTISSIFVSLLEGISDLLFYLITIVVGFFALIKNVVMMIGNYLLLVLIGFVSLFFEGVREWWLSYYLGTPSKDNIKIGDN